MSDLKIYALFANGEVTELVRDDEFWVAKDEDYDICFTTDDSGLPESSDYPFIKLCYDIRSLGEAIATLNWVRSCIKESLAWVLEGSDYKKSLKGA